MAKKPLADGQPTIIKKYANRRLYNTGTSSYITLDDLGKMTREGIDFKVVDAKSGDDITRSILTQIIMDEEASGSEMLSVSFLRDLIAMYGNSMQAMMPSYLEASMANFRKNQTKIREAFTGGIVNAAMGNPLAKMAETNLAMMKAMGDAILPGGKPANKHGADTAPTASEANSDDIAELHRQMAQMQKKLDELGK